MPPSFSQNNKITVKNTRLTVRYVIFVSGMPIRQIIVYGPQLFVNEDNKPDSRMAQSIRTNGQYISAGNVLTKDLDSEIKIAIATAM